MNSKEIEERLIRFSVVIIEVAKNIPQNNIAGHLACQISRSGTSCALNYGEARGGESMKDFIHKIQLLLKELRETLVCLKIIQQVKLVKYEEMVIKAIKENKELVSIFIKTVNTAKITYNNKKNKIH